MTVYNQPYRLSPRKLISPGDAVRLEGARGLFRFAGASENGEVAQITGPIGVRELARFVTTDRLKSAGRTPPEKVAQDDRIVVISKAAKTGARRRRRA